MAVETVTRKICDRCTKLITEAPVEKAKGATKAQKYLLVIETFGALARKPIKLEDCCQPCVDRILNLLSQIALEKKDAADADGKGDDSSGASSGEDSSAGGNGSSDDKPSEKAKAKTRRKGASAATPPA